MDRILIDQLLTQALDFLLDAAFALVLLFVGKKLIGFMMKIINRSFERAGTELSVRGFLNSLIRIVLYAALVMIIAEQIGISTASFLAVLGSAGLAVGMALQGSLSNFAGGVLILFLKPFSVGDYIVEDNKGNQGTVEKIDLFYTHLITGDNRRVIIPNGALANTSLTNVSAQKLRRVEWKVGIAYSADLRKAKELLTELLDSRERLLQDRERVVYVDELGESSVTIGFRGWVKAEDYWSEKWAVLEETKLLFDKNGIEIPFNQLDVHLTQQ